MARTSEQTAVLGRGLRVRGHIRGDGDVRIAADIEGEVAVSGALELLEGARVHGGVSAASVVVAGELEGDVEAQGTVAIAAGGSLRGDVTANELTLDEGGHFHGRVQADFDLPDAIA